MSHTTRNLLVELLVEELPPRSLQKLGFSFAEGITASLREQGLTGDDAVFTPFSSPRRLAVHIKHVAAQAADTRVSRKLMPVAVGVDANGEATPALLKKLQSLCGDAACPPVSRLKRAFDGKTEALFMESTARGATLAEGLQNALDGTLARLPIAKVMTYQLADGWSTVSFVRPAHGLVALHGAEPVRVSALGLTAGRETRGHRFEAIANPVILEDADSYAHQLETAGGVIGDFSLRRDEIERQLRAAAEKENLQLVHDEALLDEVTALVERPNVLVGRFESEFLDVPQECLILTMKSNQKYFPLLDTNGRLSHQFLIVSNIRPDNSGRIVGGNERVLRSRLADAKFFFDQDRRKTLASRVESLQRVVYHNRLGTQAERVERIWTIAQAIGLHLGGNELAAKAGETAMLSKADLLTDMVGEFPELQGTMGRYYASHDGLGDDIAIAIEDHYRPRFAGDGLPRNMPGVCVALADKLETLAGMFGIGQTPTGEKDPFALRRHALGVIRLLMEKELEISLEKVIGISSEAFGDRISFGDGERARLLAFIYERMSGQLREQGYTPQQIDAVISTQPQFLNEIPQRLAAIRAFSTLPEAGSLAAANKRVGNILKKIDGEVSGTVNAGLLQEPAEQILYAVLAEVIPKADEAFGIGEFEAALQELAALKTPVDTFFDQVLVNTDDAALRANRLALLARLQHAMNRVADISKLT